MSEGSKARPLARVAAVIRLVLQRRRINRTQFNQAGFHRWRVGEARVTKIVELEGEGFGEFLLPEADTAKARQVAWLDRGHLGPRGGLKLSVHSFVIEIDGRVILVDTNVGNGKRRRVPIWDRLATPWLQDLKRAGFDPDDIDMVICTHLHIDHVGWNTVLQKGRWTPTFPNARYVIVKDEYDYWRARSTEPERAQLFADSIQPIIDAGLADLVAIDAEVTPGIELVPTPGHTEFHVAVKLKSAGQSAMITGDFLHHPVQIAFPEIASSFDTSPEVSVQTRRAMLRALAEENTLVFGTAFADPTAGYIRIDRDRFSFEPAPSE